MTTRNGQEAGPWWQAATQNDAASRPINSSPSSSRYKGVVPQHNGWWGDQSHERQHRLWLGTFASDDDAIHYGSPAAVVKVIAHDEDDNDNDDEEKNHSSDCNSTVMAMAQQPPWEEAMFEKPLTPSDVGKLNRLVIPKQYAERYFPLDPASGEKGLQLSFEDEAGKWWRFRYSYWNSSQSYVLTKGWSRYVKEKRLGAGDVVSFHRGDRLYIRWRRRVGDGEEGQQPPHSPAAVAGGWGPVVVPSYPTHPHPSGGAQVYVRAGHHHELVHPRELGEEGATVEDNVPVTVPFPVVSSKRVVRLFGVNLDCPMELPQPARSTDGPYCWTPGPLHSPVCFDASASHPP